jgi:hypothetical protein
MTNCYDCREDGLEVCACDKGKNPGGLGTPREHGRGKDVYWLTHLPISMRLKRGFELLSGEDLYR